MMYFKKDGVPEKRNSLEPIQSEHRPPGSIWYEADFGIVARMMALHHSL